MTLSNPALNAALDRIFQQMVEAEKQRTASSSSAAAASPPQATAPPPLTVQSALQEMLSKGLAPSPVASSSSQSKKRGGKQLPSLPSASSAPSTPMVADDSSPSSSSPLLQKQRRSGEGAATVHPTPARSNLLPPIAAPPGSPSAGTSPSPVRFMGHNHFTPAKSHTCGPGSSSSSSPLHAHIRCCAECARDAAAQTQRQVDKFLRRETEFRERVVRECFSAYETYVTRAWLGVREHRDQIRQREERSDAIHDNRLRVETDLANALMKELRIVRRNVTTEWEVGFDEIGALQRISLRHILQIREVTERSLAKRTADEEAERVQYEQQRQRKMANRQVREIALVENEEVRGRRHIVECEESVDTAIFLVFRDHRKKLIDTEGHIISLILRHQQKLQQFETEKEKMKSEETMRREGNLNMEKRAYEVMIQLEPEVRRRAQQLTQQRLKKDAVARQALLTDSALEKVALEADEQVAREALHAQQVLGIAQTSHRTQRRLIAEGRKVWRAGVEARSAKELLAEDNRAWDGRRAEFERTMVFTAVAEEAAARTELSHEKQIEKQFIWGLLRARQMVFQQEHRARSDLVEERRLFLDEFEEKLRISQDQSMFVWLETIRRRTVEEEWVETQTEFVQYQPFLVAAAVATHKYPRTKAEKPVQSTTSDMCLHLHCSAMQWLFLSQGCALLEYSSLRLCGATMSDVKNLPVSVEIMNPTAGDMVYFDEGEEDRFGNRKEESSSMLSASSMVGSFQLRTTYSGHPSGLMASIKYSNTSSWSKFRMLPRVVKVRLEGMTFITYVFPAMPLCMPPEILLSTRIAMPLANLSVPSSTDFKSFRCILTLPEEAMAQGHKLAFVLPSEYFNHPKNGIVLNGKQQMKLIQNTESLLEFEMDTCNANLRPLLNAVKLVHGDDITACAPLSLVANLLRRGDAIVVRVRQLIDIDRCNVDSPRLRASSLDIPLHAICASTTEKNYGYLPKIQQNIFHNCFVTFPEMMMEVVGGTLHFEFGDHDRLASLELNPSSESGFCVHPRDPTRLIDKASADRLTEDRDAKVPDLVDFGTILGQGSPSMIIKLQEGQAYATAFINNLFQSVAIQSNRYSSGGGGPGSPKAKEAKALPPMQLLVRINMSLHDDPIFVTFNVIPGPSVVESSAKFGTFRYKEGSGAKAFPSMQLKPWPVVGTKVGPEAVLHIKVVDGLKEFDWIELLDTHERQDKLVHMQAGQSIATVHRISDSELYIHISGDLTDNAPWMRSCISDPYKYSTATSALLGNFDIAAQHVNVLLRSLRYKCRSVDPQMVEKKILVVVDNGLSGRSAIVFNLNIETVDNPTDIVLGKSQLEYRQMSRAVNGGFAIMGDVRLEDVDSDNFHGGYITVEHVSPGPAEVGDSLTILTPAQQDSLIYGCKNPPYSTTTYLGVLLSQASEAWKLGALSTVFDEAPDRFLSIRDGKLLIYAGQQIGTVNMKYSSREKDAVIVKQLRFNFFSDDRFVSFPAAEYCMRCIGFENLNPKMVCGPRMYQVTLNCTGLSSTADTVERLTITGYTAILSSPPSAPNVLYDEGGKSRQLCKLVNASLATNIFQKGFFQATILNASEGDEIQIEPNNDVKIRDMKLITVGKETFGNMPPRKAMSALRVDFLKVTGIALLTFCKAITFSSTSKVSMDPTQRQVEILCTPNGDLEQCCFTVLVDIAKRELPAEIQLAEKIVPYMSGAEHALFLRGVTVIAADRFFPIGTTAEITIFEKSKSTESLAVRSSNDCKFVRQQPPMESSQLQPGIVVILNGAEAALITNQPRQHHGTQLTNVVSNAASFVADSDTEGSATVDAAADTIVGENFVFTSAVQIQTLAELEGWELAMVFECVGYANTSRGDLCLKKPVQVTIRQRSLVLNRTTLLVEIAPRIVDFLGCPHLVQCAETKGGLICPVVRMCLVPSAREIVVSINMLSGFDFTDSIKLDHDEAELNNGLTIDGDMIFFSSEDRFDNPANNASASPDKKPQSGIDARSKSIVRTTRSFLGTITTNTLTTIVFAVEVVNNGAIQGFLRSIMLQGEPCSHKTIPVEVQVSCSYGQSKQLFRMLM